MLSKRTNRRDFLRAGFSVAALSFAGSSFLSETLFAGEPSNKPNLLLILSDDQGYADLSCIGTPDVSTPNLDKLAANGIRMTNWYSNCPICSPSRVALMSGQYPINAGMNVNIKTGKHNTGLPLETPTIADALKKLGYNTSIFGKWHLGANKDYWPTKRGFEHWFGMKGGCIDFYSHILYYEEPCGLPPIHDLYENDKEIWENGKYFTDLITERAIKYFNELAKSNDNKPFFSYLAYTDPHYPMHAPEELVEQFEGLAPERRIMAAKIKALDNSIGKVLETLRKNGQLDNTMIFFMSDNGPSIETHNWLNETMTPYYGGKTGKFRGHKQSLFEGGIRVPAIVSWPGKIPEGKVSDDIGIAMDIFPTFLTAASGDPSQYKLDGENLLPMFTKGKGSPHKDKPIFWEFRGQYAVRKGNFKLVVNGKDIKGIGPDDHVHLADLSGPKVDNLNVKYKYPEKTKELKAIADKWYKEVINNYNTYWKPKNADQRSAPPYVDIVGPMYK